MPFCRVCGSEDQDAYEVRGDKYECNECHQLLTSDYYPPVGDSNSAQRERRLFIGRYLELAKLALKWRQIHEN